MAGSGGNSVRSLIADRYDRFSAGQRRIADQVLADPELVAFGTVEALADRASTSGPTVVRFAVALGFDGFTDFRDEMRAELSRQLQTAVNRVRREPDGPIIEQVRATEIANITATLDGVDQDDLHQVTLWLADTDRRVWVLPSSQMIGLGGRFADELEFCRSRVRFLEGNEFQVMTRLAGLQPGDVVVTLDVQRHEAWLVRTQRAAVAAGAVPVALTDRLPCSLDLTGGVAFTFGCETMSPFESQLGAAVLTSTIIASLVDARRDAVASRLIASEQTWTDNGLFSP